MTELDFEQVFGRFIEKTRSITRKEFFSDLERHLFDDEKALDTLAHGDRMPRWVAVTADRFDSKFDYVYFDLLLTVLTTFHGGKRVYKPIYQSRIIKWARSKRELLHVLRIARAASDMVRFKRVIILPYPIPPVAFSITTAPR